MHLTFKIRYIHINYTLPLTFICIVSGSLGSIFNRIVHPSCCTLSRNILAELPCQPLDTYTQYSNIVTFSCQHYMFVTFFHHWWKRICGFFCQKQIEFKRIQTERNKILQPRFFHVVLFRQKQSFIIGQLVWSCVSVYAHTSVKYHWIRGSKLEKILFSLNQIINRRFSLR